ncbi:type II secretion system protein [Neobacillus mesonae]|uniref:type II secretion system protein n=1 Tax=Neobacillus mesonae TaxID=1193713 RepID=UPI00082A589E|nr:type II secretion system protein [Neobacillus mesonae]
MKSVKNEQGYTLVTVLLIITVFMILALSFMGQALSTTKQNKMIEKKATTVSAAEMGISYYQVEIQKMYESKRSEVNTYVSSIMSHPGASTTTDFKKEATVKMAEKLQSLIPTGTTLAPVQIDDHPNASFYMKDFVATADPASDSYKINISFKVIGNEDGKDTTLLTEMYLDLDTIINLPTTNNPNDYLLPTYNNIIKPETLCEILEECNPVYTEANTSFDGNNLLSSNKTIYTTGTLTLTGQGNENNISDIKIHADGDIIVGKNMNSQTKMQIETNGNATFQQNLKIDIMSKLLVRKNLSVLQQFDITNSSFVYVGENATVQKLNISSSKMCVHGDLKINDSKTVDKPENLIVLGKVYQWTKKTGNEYEYKEVVGEGNINLETFKKECGTYVPPAFQINWGNEVSPIISDVDY